MAGLDKGVNKINSFEYGSVPNPNKFKWPRTRSSLSWTDSSRFSSLFLSLVFVLFFFVARSTFLLSQILGSIESNKRRLSSQQTRAVSLTHQSSLFTASPP